LVHALATGRILCRPSYSFPASISPIDSTAIYDKSLYEAEESCIHASLSPVFLPITDISLSRRGAAQLLCHFFEFGYSQVNQGDCNRKKLKLQFLRTTPPARLGRPRMSPSPSPSLAACLGVDLAETECLFIPLQAMFHIRLALGEKCTLNN